jgi:hypothetical protein
MTSTNGIGKRHVALATLAVAAWGLGGASRALGEINTPPDDPPGFECFDVVSASLTATPSTIDYGGSATLQWSVQFPSGCNLVALTLNNSPVGRTGSLTLVPMANSSFALRASFLDLRSTLATVGVTVRLPPTVNITGNNQAPLLVQALGTPNTLINVANQVQMNLSGRSNIVVAPGVRLIGGRTPREPGPRLYTTTSPTRLFVLAKMGWPENTWADNVRISGLRIDGGVMGVAGEGTPAATGITVHSCVNVEIDNNEIYGWRGSGVDVRDLDDQRIALGSNPMTVRIHDNYIHHNQHEGKLGYGVVASKGAYALIEKNVFDWNRHAIAGDGSDGSGYLAYRNLVLEEGGLHEWLLVGWYHTHMFDMHGQDDCWGDRNCGPAGEYMDIRYNSFLFTADSAFKLRGTPAIRADVAQNVFKHRSLFDTLGPVNTFIVGALSQTESGLTEWDNQVDVDESDEYGRCDFDADGILDDFFATGATWWFNSGGDRHWVYLNTSTRRLAELTLGDVTGDGRCDVVAGGVVSSGGTGPWRPRQAGILWQNTSGQVAVWTMEGGSIQGEAYPGIVDASWQIKGTGDFDGDGRGDILWQQTTGQVAIWRMSRGTRMAESYPGAAVPATWSIQGVADFDGDGRSDILWRDGTGQLAVWFKGDLADAVTPAVYPGYANSPAPVDRSWQVKGTGDFDGDGRSDILWRHTDGQVAIWRMAGGVKAGESYPGGKVGPGWVIQGVADFDADGRSDILWRDLGGQLAIWFGGDAGRAAYPSYRNTPGPADPSWRVQGLMDYDGDGRSDILWRNDRGQLAIWLMAGARFVADVYPRQVDAAWQIKGQLAEVAW